MNCIICGKPVSTVGVCADIHCQIDRESIICDNTLTDAYRNGTDEHFEFLLEISRLAATSSRREKIFTPFPNAFLPPTVVPNYDRKLQITPSEYFVRIDKLHLTRASTSRIVTILREVSIATTNNDDHAAYSILGDLYMWARFVIISNQTQLQRNDLAVVKSSDNDEQLCFTQFEIKHTDAIEYEFRHGWDTFHHLNHGSAPENWHSILRNGIQVCSGSNYQAHGAACGNGVCLGSLATAGGYSSMKVGSYQQRTRKKDINDYTGSSSNTQVIKIEGKTIVAVFEIRGPPERFRKRGGWCSVVPDTREMILRFIIIASARSLVHLESALNDKYSKREKARSKVASRMQQARIKRLNREIKLLEEQISSPLLDCGYHIDNINTVQNIINVSTVGKFKTSFNLNYSEYPDKPPIITMTGRRVVNEHIMHQGSICADILAPSNWIKLYALENMIVFIVSIINESLSYEGDTMSVYPGNTISAQTELGQTIVENGWQFS